MNRVVQIYRVVARDENNKVVAVRWEGEWAQAATMQTDMEATFKDPHTVGIEMVPVHTSKAKLAETLAKYASVG